MKSQTRQDCEDAVRLFSKQIENPPAENKLLYVGVAGDPTPKGEYSYLFPNYDTISMDIDKKWKPDIIGDITNNDLPSESFGAIVIVQVLEHIENIWELSKSMNRLLCSGGHVIIDCPLMYPYHAEWPYFGDFWRITKDGMIVLFKNEFDLISEISSNFNTSCLFRKK